MIVIPADKGYDVALVAFKRGEYILEGLTDYIKEKNVDAGLIISGIGTLDICRIHTIEHTNLPPDDIYFMAFSTGKPSRAVACYRGISRSPACSRHAHKNLSSPVIRANICTRCPRTFSPSIMLSACHFRLFRKLSPALLV